MLNSVFILLLLAGGDGVPAHKVPDLERIQRRMHAGDAELRRLRGELEGDIGENGTGFVVVGKHNPELLMRWELMNSISGALRDEDSIAKQAPKWRERGAATILGADYLQRLRNAVAPFVAAQKESDRLHAKMKNATPDELPAIRAEWSRVNDAICPLRAQALAAARAEFGEEAFDRFLYEAVAPDSIITSTGGKSPESVLEMWKWFEEGCR